MGNDKTRGRMACVVEAEQCVPPRAQQCPATCASDCTY